MFLVTLINSKGHTFAERIAAGSSFEAQQSAEQLFNARAIRVVEALTK